MKNNSGGRNIPEFPFEHCDEWLRTSKARMTFREAAHYWWNLAHSQLSDASDTATSQLKELGTRLKDAESVEAAYEFSVQCPCCGEEPSYAVNESTLQAWNRDGKPVSLSTASVTTMDMENLKDKVSHYLANWKQAERRVAELEAEVGATLNRLQSAHEELEQKLEHTESGRTLAHKEAERRLNEWSKCQGRVGELEARDREVTADNDLLYAKIEKLEAENKRLENGLSGVNYLVEKHETGRAKLEAEIERLKQSEAKCQEKE